MEKPVLSWTCEDVGLWLDDIGLNKFKEQFLSKDAMHAPIILSYCSSIIFRQVFVCSAIIKDL